MWPRSSRTGTVSVKFPEPTSRSTSVTGSPAARCSQNSLMPPSKRNSTSRGLVGLAVLLVPVGLAVPAGPVEASGWDPR